MQIENVGVVGCGIMGAGIAQICAQKGYWVFVSEMDQIALDRGLAAIEKALSKLEAAGKISEEENRTALSRVQGATGLEHLSGCDLVIEAVTEDLELKKELFSSLDRLCSPDTILATNTSVLPVIEIARATSRPEKVVGTHFLTPPPVIRLLELVRTLATGQGTLEAAVRFGESLGKKIVISEDRPGFIVNRILTSILFDAVRLLEEGVATKEDIDTAVKDGLGLPMGAFELIDLIGMDTLLLGSSSMFRELNDPHYFCPITIRRMVAAGQLGRKTGKGFYHY
jgi:3-hydroxybutyryl-CoA dehydrogenase